MWTLHVLNCTGRHCSSTDWYHFSFSCDCRVLEWLETGFSRKRGFRLGPGDHFFSACTDTQQDALLAIVSRGLTCFHELASASYRVLETA